MPRAKIPVRTVKPLTKAQKEGIVITRQPSTPYDPHMVKYTPDFIQSTIERLDRWSKGKEAFFMQSFYTLPEVDLTKDAFYQLCESNPELFEMRQKARERIIANLLEASARKKIDGTFVERIMPLIWKDYKEWTKERLKISSEAHDKTVNVHVFPGRMGPEHYEIPADVKINQIEKKDLNGN